MALPRPYETRKFTLYKGDEIRTQVAFVIELHDSVSGDFAVAPLRVRIKGREKLKPIKNMSGYYCFMDLEKGEYSVSVDPESPQKDLYSKSEVPIDTRPNNFDPSNPFTVSLKPKPSYPFLGNATLIRGVVQTQSGKVVEAAEVTAKVAGEPDPLFVSQTDVSGEYVLYFKKKPSAGIRINVRKNGKLKFKQGIIVEEGETIFVNFLDFPE